MPYATRPDLAKHGLSADTLSEIAADAQDAALASASGVVDGYLRARFTLPLLSWGDELRRVVCHIAAYDLMTVRGFDPENPSDINLRQRYEDALRWLRDVANGAITPELVDSRPSGTAPRAHVRSHPRRGW
ncbi:MAG: phage protein Gp36 family protein [Myxococcales bacterium]